MCVRARVRQCVCVCVCARAHTSSLGSSIILLRKFIPEKSKLAGEILVGKL